MREKGEGRGKREREHPHLLVHSQMKTRTRNSIRSSYNRKWKWDLNSVTSLLDRGAPISLLTIRSNTQPTGLKAFQSACKVYLERTEIWKYRDKIGLLCILKGFFFKKNRSLEQKNL